MGWGGAPLQNTTRIFFLKKLAKGCTNELTVSMNCFHRNDLAPSLVTTSSLSRGWQVHRHKSRDLTPTWSIFSFENSSVADSEHKHTVRVLNVMQMTSTLVGQCAFLSVSTFPRFRVVPFPPLRRRRPRAHHPLRVGGAGGDRLGTQIMALTLRIFKCLKIMFPFFSKRNVNLITF
jgi:hypothetical protein